MTNRLAAQIKSARNRNRKTTRQHQRLTQRELMQQQALSPVHSPSLSELEPFGIRHGFFTKEGGVSDGIYASLNVGLGSHDDAEKVLENRRRVAAWFGQPPERLATVHQIHSTDVIIMDDRYNGTRLQADAMVTATPGLILGVLAADCGPILFADAKAGVIGAAHAGWKGALGGIAENVISAMISLGASLENITAALGPSIGPASYEVGPEFVERFVTQDPRFERYFTPSTKAGHAMFDLPSLTTQRLLNAGVRAENLAIDTYPDQDRFFSYRRTTHAREPDYGRQISAIAIMET